MDGTGIVILFYTAALIAFGARAGRRAQSGEPGLFAAAASLCAGFIGGGFSLGNAAAGYSAGLSNAAALCGFSVGQLFVALYAAPRLAALRGARTAGDVAARAFGGDAKRFTGLLSVLFCTGILGAQINAFGAVATGIFGADPRVCAAVGFAVIIFYTALGGPRAALQSDAVQIPALLAALTAASAVLLRAAGGVTSLYAALPPSFTDILGGSPRAFFSLFFTFALGEMLCPPAVARLIAARDVRTARRAGVLAAALSVPFFFISSLLGSAARALGTTDAPAFALPSALRAALPFPLGALALGAMLCVYLCAGGAFLSACASALVLDVLPATYARGAALLRAGTLLCGGAALALALAFDGVLSILVVAYCFWCPAMLVPLLFALRGRRAPRRLFFCSAGLSVAAVLVWRVLGEPFGVSPMLAGLGASAAVFAAAPLFNGKRKKI